MYNGLGENKSVSQITAYLVNVFCVVLAFVCVITALTYEYPACFAGAMMFASIAFVNISLMKNKS